MWMLRSPCSRGTIASMLPPRTSPSPYESPACRIALAPPPLFLRPRRKPPALAFAVAHSTHLQQMCQIHKLPDEEPAYYQTVYDHEDWSRHRRSTRHSRHIRSMASSQIVVAVGPPVFSLTFVAVAVAAFNDSVLAGLLPSWLPLLRLSSLPFQLAAPALALLLVFRTNTSYGRFDEAMKAWGLCLNRSRDMARQALTLLRHSADAMSLRKLIRLLIAFSYCLKDHLARGDLLSQELNCMLEENDAEALIASRHRPNYVVQMMTKIIHNAHLSDMEKSIMDSNLTQFHDIVGNCERIFRTPIPLAYTRLTSRILVVWHLLLPLALWDQCLWVIIPATFLSAAILFSIEEVGVFIEEPFSILPLDYICTTIRTDLENLMQAHEEISAHLKCGKEDYISNFNMHKKRERLIQKNNEAL